MKFDENIMRVLKNFQVNPSRTRVEINDKTAKIVFDLTEEQYKNLMSGKVFKIVEKRHHPKHGKITSPVSLINEENFGDVNPLTEFERDVLSVCISEWCNGVYYTTPAIIFRALVGKVAEVGVTPSKDQKAAILHAIEKLKKTKFSKIFAEAYDLLNYKTDGLTSASLPLLSSKFIPAKINGQPYEVIFFNQEPPLLTHARVKNQIVRYDTRLLDVPNMNNTPRIIAIKNYIMRRISEIKLHRQLAPTLRFDTIFRNCRIENLDRKSKSNARNIIFRFFEHLRQKGFIDSYELTKNKMGNVYHSISFTYSKPNKESVQKNSAQNSASFSVETGDYNNSSSRYNNSSAVNNNSSPRYNNYSTKPKKRKAKKSKK